MVHDHRFSRSGVSGHFRALLGFNEPDISSQANMRRGRARGMLSLRNPHHAAAMWQDVQKIAQDMGVKKQLGVKLRLVNRPVRGSHPCDWRTRLEVGEPCYVR